MAFRAVTKSGSALDMKDVGKYITGMWIQVTADNDHNSTHSANETKKTYYKGVPCNETIGDTSHHTP